MIIRPVVMVNTTLFSACIFSFPQFQAFLGVEIVHEIFAEIKKSHKHPAWLRQDREFPSGQFIFIQPIIKGIMDYKFRAKMIE
jgi:hypothetical protein